MTIEAHIEAIREEIETMEDEDELLRLTDEFEGLSAKCEDRATEVREAEEERRSHGVSKPDKKEPE